MNHLDRSDFGFCAVSLASILLLSGCASTAASVVNSYEVPATIDLKQVLDIVEQSTARVFGSPVTVTEGTMPSVLPLVASPARVERRHRVLEGLGVVVIPHVHCPGSIATVEKRMAGPAGLRVVTACIAPTRTATFIQLVEGAAEEERTLIPAAASSGPPQPSAISSVGRLLLERLSGSRSVGNPAAVTAGGAFLSESHLVAENDRAATRMYSKEHGADPGFLAVPLACFAPRTESISVRTGPDSSLAVDTLTTELIVEVESPINTGYVHVETREGVAGWVRRSDLRWTPCPIG
jgi:hypothetical protein